MKVLYFLPLFIALVIASVPLKASERAFTEDAIVLTQGDKRIILPKEIAHKAKTIKDAHQTFGKHEIAIPVDINLSKIEALIIAFHNHRNLSGKALLDAVEKEFGASNFSHELLSACDYLGFKKGINIFARAIARSKMPYLLKLNYNILLAVARYYYLLHEQDLEGVKRKAVNFSTRDYLDYLSRCFNEDPESIFLEGKRLRKISVDTFQGFTNLQKLYLGYNQLTHVDPEIFKGLTGLKELYLRNNQLTQVDPAILKHLTNLTWLDLDQNHLTKLDPALFRDLPKLAGLALSHNELTKLDPASFNVLTNLTQLCLDHNKLTQLDPALFRGLTSLRLLYLDNNLLTLADREALAGLKCQIIFDKEEH